MAFISQLLSAISAIKGLADLVYLFAQQVTAWYVQNARKEVMKDLADAAAASYSAESDEDLANASALWKKALSQPRVLK